MQRLGLIPIVLAALLALAACSGGQPAGGANPFTPIPPADFPTTLGGGFPVAQVSAPAAAPVEIGQPAPNFAFVWADGRGADLAGLRGRPVVLNFWATWCAPCRAEMPELVELHRTNPAVQLLEINTQEGLDAIRPFAEAFAMTMPVLVDEAGAVRSLYGVRSMPTTLFIDSAGIVRARWAGLLTGDQLNEFVGQLQ